MRARYPSLSYSLPLLQFPARLSSFPVDLLWDWSFPRIFPTLFPCPPLSIFPMLPLSACFLSSSVEGSGGGRDVFHFHYHASGFVVTEHHQLSPSFAFSTRGRRRRGVHDVCLFARLR